MQIQEKEKMYTELKSVLERQPGPEVVEQLSIYEHTLKDKTKQLKAMASELSILFPISFPLLILLPFTLFSPVPGASTNTRRRRRNEAAAGVRTYYLVSFRSLTSSYFPSYSHPPIELRTLGILERRTSHISIYPVAPRLLCMLFRPSLLPHPPLLPPLLLPSSSPPPPLLLPLSRIKD